MYYVHVSYISTGLDFVVCNVDFNCLYKNAERQYLPHRVGCFG